MVGLHDNNGCKNTTCLEQVGLLMRAKEISCLLALSDNIEVTRKMLPKLGRGKAYTRQREIEETCRSIASQTQQYILQMIKLVHDSNQESPMFERVLFGGSLFGTATEQELHSWCV